MSVVLSLQGILAFASSRPRGYVEDVLSHAEVDGDKVTLADEVYASLAAKYRGASVVRVPRLEDAVPAIVAAASPPGRGPGAELKALLGRIGIVASPGCPCNAHAANMDAMEAREPGWCLANLETICDWLQEEAARRKLPFVRAAARMLVRAAIRRAQNKGNG